MTEQQVKIVRGFRNLLVSVVQPGPKITDILTGITGTDEEVWAILERCTKEHNTPTMTREEIDNPVQSKEVVPVYNSLEEISEDVSIARGRWDHDSADKELDEIIEKLQNTISSGAYIKGDGKE